jgi:Sec-independent protein translocase protein TatA
MEEFYMSDNEDTNENRIRKYTFDDTVSNAQTTPNTKIWPIIIVIIVVSALILGGVKTITYFTSNVTAHDKTTKTVPAKDNNTNYENKNVNSSSHKPKHSSTNNNAANKTDNHIADSSFTHTKIFTSVEDAQNYAKTTQSQWIQAGYQTYTISADSQGYYILKFIK